MKGMIMSKVIFDRYYTNSSFYMTVPKMKEEVALLFGKQLEGFTHVVRYERGAITVPVEIGEIMELFSAAIVEAEGGGVTEIDPDIDTD
jgi:hypothetical protein